MGKCIKLSIVVCLILTLNISAKTITSNILSNSLLESTNTYTLNPIYTSWPTYNDTGDLINNGLQAHFAFDLSSIPDNATVISASFSAYICNLSTVASQRKLWYNSDDNWNDGEDYGESVIADKIVGTLWHDESTDSGYVWKTFSITYDGWADEIANDDNRLSLMLTGGQYGAVGLTPGTLGYNWGVLSAPELTLTILWTQLPITVTSPNGGELWLAGTEHTITWDSNEAAGANVKIELYNGGSYSGDIISSTSNDGAYTWAIPSALQAGTTYKIKITDTGNSAIYDYSDGYFSISDPFLPSGSLQFKSSSYSVTENDGGVRIYVSRTGGSYGAASVKYATSNETATAGSDYTEKIGTLNWSNGDTADKYFDVSINDDSTYESNESFKVGLSNVIGASLGSPSQVTVTVIDNDSPVVTINPPEVTTLSTVYIADSNATLRGQIVFDGYDGGVESCQWRFSYWKYGDAGNIITTNWECCVNEGQKFSLYVDGLEPDTNYFVIAQAANSAGTSQGDIKTFTTLPGSVDPNDILPAVINPDEINTLLIQNFVEQFQVDPNAPHANQGLLTYVEKAGNLNEIDVNDVFYAVTKGNSSKIISLIQAGNLKSGKTVFYELSKDARPFPADANIPNESALIELSIYSPYAKGLSIISENCLKFWIADNNSFNGQPVTIQMISADPNVEYPVWDIRNIIEENGRKLPLDYLLSKNLNPDEITDPNITVKLIEPNVPYAWFTLSTSREIADINDNGIIDINDYKILLADLGKQGILRSDIASLIKDVIVLGIPDGEVNEIDRSAFVAEYNKLYPDDPIVSPVIFSEGFESGKIREPFTTSVYYPWIISTNAYEGSYCVKSGNIGKNKSSILQASINAPSGQISFCMKVSCESDFDNLTFYIDGIETGRWSGERNWEEINFQTTPGTHIFKWVYKKDFSDDQGEDAAWIDDIAVY
ncbi:MAG: hypothetical protein JW787_08790 [Sedimentisphaerales bacterium]|nr:hypothetical protein [Sedimentisphaerales bacterium]